MTSPSHTGKNISYCYGTIKAHRLTMTGGSIEYATVAHPELLEIGKLAVTVQTETKTHARKADSTTALDIARYGERPRIGTLPATSVLRAACGLSASLG